MNTIIDNRGNQAQINRAVAFMLRNGDCQTLLVEVYGLWRETGFRHVPESECFKFDRGSRFSHINIAQIDREPKNPFLDAKAWIERRGGNPDNQSGLIYCLNLTDTCELELSLGSRDPNIIPYVPAEIVTFDELFERWGRNRLTTTMCCCCDVNWFIRQTLSRFQMVNGILTAYLARTRVSKTAIDSVI